jgi:hypothetical protein
MWRWCGTSPCPDHAPITFTVDGRRAEPSVADDEGRRDPLDLALT